MIPEKKTVASLLHLLQVLLKSSTAGLQNKYQIGCIIANLINLNLSIWNPENLHTVAENIFTWIDLIKDNFHSEHPMRENLISLCSLLCHSVLK